MTCGEEIENGEFKGKTLEVPEARASAWHIKFV